MPSTASHSQRFPTASPGSCPGRCRSPDVTLAGGLVRRGRSAAVGDDGDGGDGDQKQQRRVLDVHRASWIAGETTGECDEAGHQRNALATGPDAFRMVPPRVDIAPIATVLIKHTIN